ncbi:MAG: type I methionyl aminopeptidase, partial [Spirochaetota bacterium]
LKSADDMARIAEAGRILNTIFSGLSRQDLVSHTTLEVDSWIQHTIRACRARSAFETVNGYGHASCISLNDEAVHGVPSRRRRIQNGDVVSIDIGVVKNGYFADACRTFVAGIAVKDVALFVHRAREILDAGLSRIRPGLPLYELGRTFETEASAHGYSVLKQFTGHGVGYSLHEAPVILHYHDPAHGLPLQEGMVIALEPVVAQKPCDVQKDADGWTVKTVDGTLTAQFEETVAVTKDGPRILT